MSMIIKNVNSNFIHKIDMQPENICVTEEFMYNPFVFFYRRTTVNHPRNSFYAWETLFVTNQIFAVVIFLSFVTMKNQLSELACLTNLTISVMKDNAFKQDIKSNFFSSLKAVLYQFWPYKLYDNYMVLTLT